VAAAISALALAPLSDRRGRRIFLWGGSLLFGVASLACSMAWDFTSMLMFRFLVGFAGGIMSMSAQALVGDHFPHARRGSAMGTVLAGRFLGLSLGVVIGILFAQWLGWPVTFLFIAVIAFFSAWPAWRMIPQVTPQFHQSRSPLQLYRQLLSDTPSLYTVLVSMFNSAGLGGFLFFIGIWLEESFGFALWQIATVFVLTGMLSFGGSLVSGRYADRYGRTLVIRWGNLLCALAFVVIPLTAGHFWLTGVFFAILSLAVALWMPPLHTLVTELAPASARGSLVALKNAAALVGIACAQSIGGYLYDSGGYVLVGLCSATLYIAGWALVQWKIPETIA
jgi:predicted MFS family arabinose efflux permease